MPYAQEMAAQVPVSRVCAVLALSRSCYYRYQKPPTVVETAVSKPERKRHPRALTPAEEKAVRNILHSERFQDMSPYEVYGTLLDEEGRYLCSVRTMYRILHKYDETTPRGRQRARTQYRKPELLATAVNQVWSWDGRPFGRLVNVSSDTAHHQGCVSLPWRSKEPSSLGLVSFQGTRASRAKEADFQYANVQEWMDRG